MVRVHLRLLVCGASTDLEAFLRTRTAGGWQGRCQMGAWESGLGNGGMWADAVCNGGAGVVQVGWEMVLSVVVGEVTYNVKDLDKNTESKVDPKIG